MENSPLGKMVDRWQNRGRRREEMEGSWRSRGRHCENDLIISIIKGGRDPLESRQLPSLRARKPRYYAKLFRNLYGHDLYFIARLRSPTK